MKILYEKFNNNKYYTNQSPILELNIKTNMP